MRSLSIVPRGLAGRAAGFLVALLPLLTRAAPPASIGDQAPSTPAPPAAEEAAPVDVPSPPPGDVAPPGDAPPGSVPADATPPVDPAEQGEGNAGAEGGDIGGETSSEPDLGAASPSPTTAKKKKKPEGGDRGEGADARASDPKAKAKRTKKKEKHKINQGTAYHLGLFPASYVQDPRFSVGARAGIRQRFAPKKNHQVTLGLDYEYEPFSIKTLGFPEEDETTGHIQRTLVQPMHILAGHASRRIEWGKLVTTSLDLDADAWWPGRRQHQRWSLRLTPGIRIGRTTGLFGEISSELYYKKFPNYYIDAVMRRIDQEGVTPTGLVGYNFRKLARIAAGFSFDFTHYLDAHYNAVAADGTMIRSKQSKNYLDYIPFADVMLRPTRGLRIRARYAFELQKTQHYDRVMTGRDEFASLTAKYFQGYYDYRRHRANLWITWEFRKRLRLAAAAGAWVRHFDVYETRTVDNFWTGELRLDAEIEGSLEIAVRVHTIKRAKMQHDFFISLLGAHISRASNMKREISLATNFDITRVFLGFEVRGR
ncbi:hypothetical protein [Nannocystis pusilla]|uniref:hypothetical protein n=1 Tax=Nannocystis pusilla TaxID=889268 RepID=UPI003BF08A49